MKKSRQILVVLIFIFVLTILIPNTSIGCSTTDTHWDRLGKMGIKNVIQVTKLSEKNKFKVDMAEIKEVLEKSGVNEKVTILFVGDNEKEIASLGTYIPGGTVVSADQSTTSFNSIPKFAEIAVQPDTMPRGVHSVESGTFPPRLPMVFKNAQGLVKAKINVPIKEK